MDTPESLSHSERAALEKNSQRMCRSAPKIILGSKVKNLHTRVPTAALQSALARFVPTAVFSTGLKVIKKSCTLALDCQTRPRRIITDPTTTPPT